MWGWISARLAEPSTWRGILLILTGGAASAVPVDLMAQVAVAGLTASGVVGAVTKG